MKMESWAERIGAGLVGLLSGGIILLVVALTFDFWWPMLGIPLVCMVLAVLIGDPVIKFLTGCIEACAWWG